MQARDRSGGLRGYEQMPRPCNVWSFTVSAQTNQRPSCFRLQWYRRLMETIQFDLLERENTKTEKKYSR